VKKVGTGIIVEAAMRGKKAAVEAVNKERADRAKKALRAWIPPVTTDGFNEDKLETDILGLMIDLLHFAEQSKMEIKPLIDLAVTNFEMETGGFV